MDFQSQLYNLAGIGSDGDGGFLTTLNNLANAQVQGGTVSNQPSMPVAPSPAQLGTGQAGAQQAISNAPYQAPQFTMPAAAPAAPAAQMGPTQAAAMGQQPANPLNQPVGPVQPQMNAGRGAQGGPTLQQLQAAGLTQPTPVMPQAQTGAVFPTAYQGPGGGQAMPIPTAIAPTQASQQAYNPFGAQPGQTVDQVTPQDLATDQIFGKMLGAESGNQNYLPNGQAVVSPTGAKYAAQVQPETARNPGYGVRPAQADTPEEYNRVGREYFEAMNKKYDGNREKAVAAYNAGPGRVDHAIKLAEQNGGDWKQYLPAETQQYLAKVNPKAVEQQVANATTQQQKQATPVTGAMPQNPQSTGNEAHDELIAAGIDPQKLMNIAYDKTGKYDDTTRKAAYTAARDMLDHQFGMEQVAKQLQADPQKAIAKAQQNTPEGSRFRAMLYELAGAKQAAADEYNKLGVGSSWQPGFMTDDKGNLKRYSVYMTPDGQAKRAIDSSTGQEVTDPKTLGALNGGGIAMKGAATGQTMGFDKNNHAISHTVLPNGQGVIWKDETTGTVLPGAPEGYRTTSESSEERARTNMAAQIEKRMRQDNSDAARTNSTPPHTEEQIAEQVARAKSGQPLTYSAPVQPTPVAPVNPNAPQPTNKPVDVNAVPQAPVEGAWATPEANEVARRNPTAESIAKYLTAPPSSTGRNSAGSSALMNDVRKINPEYNEQRFKEAQLTRNDYAKVSPSSAGGQVQAINRAIPHLDQLEMAAKALENGNMPLVNSIANQFHVNLGDDKASAARAIQNLVSSEVQKAVTGGLGGIEERKDLSEKLSTNLSPKALASVVRQYQGLMATQAEGLKQNWTSHGLPAKEWDEKLVPRAREVVQRAQKENNNTRGNW